MQHSHYSLILQLDFFKLLEMFTPKKILGVLKEMETLISDLEMLKLKLS